MINKDRLVPFIAGTILICIFICLHMNYENKKSKLDSSTKSIKTTFLEYKKRIKTNSWRTQTMYIPQYHYIVDDKVYICSIPNESCNIKPSDKPTTIYYNSKYPKSCLVEEKYSINFYILFLGIFTIIFGCFYKGRN